MFIKFRRRTRRGGGVTHQVFVMESTRVESGVVPSVALPLGSFRDTDSVETFQKFLRTSMDYLDECLCPSASQKLKEQLIRKLSEMGTLHRLDLAL